MCKSISIFIIQCPPKIMYIYIHMTCLSGYFEEISTQQKPSIGALTSNPENSKQPPRPLACDFWRPSTLVPGKSATKMVGKQRGKSTDDKEKGGSPRGSSKLAGLLWKKTSRFTWGEVIGFWSWKQMTWFRFLVPKKPFFDLGKLVTFPNRPRFFWSLTSQNLWDVGESSPVQQRLGKLRYWRQDYAQLFGLGARVSWAKTREKFTSKMVLVLSVCSSETWDNNLQLKQKSPFFLDNFTFLYFRPYDLTRGFVGARNINCKDFCSSLQTLHLFTLHQRSLLSSLKRYQSTWIPAWAPGYSLSLILESLLFSRWAVTVHGSEIRRENHLGCIKTCK